jgi:regulator of RNase E activity RraB
MQFPRPDGLSSQEEADALWKVGDKLTSSLEKELHAVFAGRITTQGRREFYFYVSRVPENSLVIDRALNAFTQCQYEIGVRDDSTWGQYLSVLYPSAEELEKIKNRQVLEVLQKKGDQLEERRDVSHWIYFKGEGDHDKLCVAMRELGYEILPPFKTERDASHIYGTQIRRSDRVDQESIDAAVLEVFRFTKAADGKYDGWETEVVRPLSPFKSFLRQLGL